MKKYKYVVFIGRFQLIHKGHEHVIREALKQAEHVIIIVGSAYRPRDMFNPFTYEERKTMISNVFAEEIKNKSIIIKAIPDIEYNNTAWVESIQKSVKESIYEIDKLQTVADSKIALIGHKKDSSSYYLSMFPFWDQIEVNNYDDLSSTPLREKYFSNIGHMWIQNADGHRVGDKEVEHIIPTAIRDFLVKFLDTSGYKYVQAEHQANDAIKSKWIVTTPDGRSFPPYPVTFNATDAVVIQSGSVLMIKRKYHPGKGQWALPGGYVDVDETLVDSMIRELKEETKIKVPKAVLKGSIITTHTFDAVKRSARGRIFSHAFLIKLADEPNFPKTKMINAAVEADDDAAEAKWIPLADLNYMMDTIFEDHYSIISYFKAFI